MLCTDRLGQDDFFYHFERSEETIEKFFNVAGYFPVIQQISGNARSVLGTVQACAMVIFGSGAFFKAVVDTVIFSDRYAANNSFYVTERCFGQALHGICNVIRGQLETIPVVSTLFFVIFDTIGFRAKYPHELV